MSLVPAAHNIGPHTTKARPASERFRLGALTRFTRQRHVGSPYTTCYTILPRASSTDCHSSWNFTEFGFFSSTMIFRPLEAVSQLALAALR